MPKVAQGFGVHLINTKKNLCAVLVQKAAQGSCVKSCARFWYSCDQHKKAAQGFGVHLMNTKKAAQGFGVHLINTKKTYPGFWCKKLHRVLV